MLCQKFSFFIIVMVYLCGTNVYAMTISDEEKAKIKDELHPIFRACMEQYGVTEKTCFKNLENMNPCIMACYLKKTELMDSKGFYDIQKSMDMTKHYIKDEDTSAKLIKVSKECSKVNDAKVSDGDKGCERSKLFLKCYAEHESELV